MLQGGAGNGSEWGWGVWNRGGGRKRIPRMGERGRPDHVHVEGSVRYGGGSPTVWW